MNESLFENIHTVGKNNILIVKLFIIIQNKNKFEQVISNHILKMRQLK